MTWGADYASVDNNEPPDFAKFRAAGASMCWIRSSYGYHDNRHSAWVIAHDAAFQRDWKNAKLAGLVCGGYMFPVLAASQTPEEQVAVFVAAVAAQGGLEPGVDFPPCLDVEFPGRGIADTGLDRAGVMAWIRRAVVALKAAYGCWPIIYTSGRVWNDHDADCLGDPPAPDLRLCPLWLARYALATRQPAVLPPPDVVLTNVPTPWQDEWHAHQDQGDALGVPGFTATVDVDRFRTAKPGDAGGHVAWLQRKLVTLPGPQAGPLNADGVYGADLEQAVRALQASKGLVVDGIVGAKTFAAIAWM